jgi:hypothetical protein
MMNWGIVGKQLTLSPAVVDEKDSVPLVTLKSEPDVADSE